MSPAPALGDSPAPAAVGFIGLGAMGSPMSRHLLAAGFEVFGHDIDPGSMARHRARGGAVVADIAELGGLGVVITSLPSASALDVVLETLGPVAARGDGGLVIIETSTLSLTEKFRARDAAAAHGITVLDCPVSGTSAQAENGDLVAYLSGSDPDALARARPVLAGMTRAVHLTGEFGSGTKMKLVANLLVAVHNLAAAEALLLAERAGLDLDLVLAAVGDGAGGSRMLSVRGPLMVADDFDRPTARVAVFQKDLRAIQALSVELSSPTPLLAASTVYYDLAVAQGRADQDTACLFGVLKQAVRQPRSDLS